MTAEALSTYPKWKPESNSSYQAIIDEQGKLLMSNPACLKRFETICEENGEFWFQRSLSVSDRKVLKSLLSEISATKSKKTVSFFHSDNEVEAVSWTFEVVTETENIQFLCIGRTAEIFGVRDLKTEINYEHARHLISEDHAPLGLATKDFKLLLSKKAVRLLDLPVSMAGQPFDLVHLWKTIHFFSPESGESVSYEKNPILECLQSGKPVASNLCVTLSTAKICKLNFRVQPLNASLTNSPLSVLVSFSKETELSLASAIAYASLESAETEDQILWITNRQKNLIFGNTAFRANFPANQAAESDELKSLVPHDFFQTISMMADAAIFSRKVVFETKYLHRSNGNAERYLIRAIPIAHKEANNLVVFLANSAEVEKPVPPTFDSIQRDSPACLLAGGLWEWDIAEGNFRFSEKFFELLNCDRPSCKKFFWWYRHLPAASKNALNDAIRQALLKLSSNFSQELDFELSNTVRKKLLVNGFIIYENGLPSRIVGSVLPLNSSMYGYPNAEQRIDAAETILLTEENERSQVGEWLAKDLGGSISTVKLYLEMMQVNNSAEILRSKAIDYLSATLKQIRESRFQMFGPLQSTDLISMLKKVVGAVNAEGKLQLHFSSMGEQGQLSQLKQLSLVRITQKQLQNIMEHAKAHIVTVTLNWCRDGVELEIADNGDVSSVDERSESFGLADFYDRIRFCDGKLSVDTKAGKGTRLAVKMPY